MQLKELEKRIRKLILLEPSEAPLLSCYFNLSTREPFVRSKFALQAQTLRTTLSNGEHDAFDEAVRRVEDFLFDEIKPSTQGASVFARGGRQPFWMALQFHVELPTWITVGPVPNVYHLVEFKDSYHRFVIMLSLPHSTRIIEVNLGAITEELWSRFPATRANVSAGWSRGHYIHHRQQQPDHFIREKINVLNRLMDAGAHTHLILAGTPAMTEKVKSMLPKHLAAKLVYTAESYRREGVSDIVRQTIEGFVAREEMESRAVVDRLVTELRIGGLAVVGIEQTMRALEWGQADVLVLTKDFDPNHLVKEMMVRLAETKGCSVEIVNESNELRSLGGVGCILRYAAMSGPT